MVKSAPVIVVEDTGNGALKIMSSMMDKPEVYDALLGSYKMSDRKSLNQKGSAPRVTTYTINDKDYVLGFKDASLVKADKHLLMGRVGDNRYGNPHFHTYAKIGLAKATKHTDQLNVLLVTSTPAHDATLDSVKKKLSDALKKTHTIGVNGEDPLTIKVTRHEVVSETEAVIYDLYLGDDGFVADEKIVGQNVIVVNAGFGTTDVSQYNEMEYIRLETETLTKSYYDVVSACHAWLQDQTGRNIDFAEVTQQLSQQHDQKTKKFVNVIEEVEGFNEIYQDAVSTVFESMISDLTRIIEDPQSYHRIIVVGGAAEVWGELFKEWSKRVFIPKEPQLATVRGMYKYAKYVVLTEEEGLAEASKEVSPTKE